MNSVVSPVSSLSEFRTYYLYKCSDRPRTWLRYELGSEWLVCDFICNETESCNWIGASQPKIPFGTSQSRMHLQSRDEFGIFMYDAGESQDECSGKRVRFAALLKPVVAKVEKLANETDGRWTRGLHKRTLDEVAEKHLRELGLSQVRNRKGSKDSVNSGQPPAPPTSILRSFKLCPLQESIRQTLMQCKMSIQTSETGHCRGRTKYHEEKVQTEEKKESDAIDDVHCMVCVHCPPPVAHFLASCFSCSHMLALNWTLDVRMLL
jgi:hypothetical protein